MPQRSWRTPPEVRQLVRDRTELYRGRRSTPRQRDLLAVALAACFENEKDAVLKKQSVLLYLCQTDDIAALTDESIYALLDWLAPERVEGGWLPARKAIREANAILSAFLEERGQRRLL